MTDYASDEEQIDAMRKWWDENGKFVIAGVVLGIAALIGWNRYNAHQVEQSTLASGVYETLMEAARSGDTDTMIASAEQLARDYSATPYRGQAPLVVADYYMERGNTELAVAALRELLEVDTVPELKLIARLRLAKAYLQDGSVDEARSMVAGVSGSNLQARFDEMLGDIETVAGNSDAARTAYQAALSSDRLEPAVSQYLSLKLESLGSAEAVQ